MGQFSPDIYVMKDAIQKVSSKVFRDFIELENLQNSPVTANRFANMTFEKVKEVLLSNLEKNRKDYNIILKDNEIIKNKNAEYSFIVNPICGKSNFVHSIPYFCICINVLKNTKEKKEVVMAVIDNVIEKETYFVEKGRGAFVNTRRIRVSARAKLEYSLVALKLSKNREKVMALMDKVKLLKINNCSPLDILNTCSGKYDAAVILDRDNIDTDFAELFARESGAIINFINDDRDLIISNGLIQKELLDILK